MINLPKIFSQRIRFEKESTLHMPESGGQAPYSAFQLGGEVAAKLRVPGRQLYA